MAFEQAGDAVRAATLRGELALKSDQPAEAAACFVQGHDFLRAAELYESVGLLAEAAGAYEAGRELGRRRRRLHPRGPQGQGRRGLREGGRVRDRGQALRGDRRRKQGGRALRARRRHLQERRGGRARGRAREGDRAPAARAACGRELPGAPPSSWRGSSSRPAGPRSRWSGCARRSATSRSRPRTSTSTTGSRSRTRRPAAPAEALALYKKIQSEDLQFRDVAKRVARLAGGQPPASGAGCRRAPAAAAARPRARRLGRRQRPRLAAASAPASAARRSASSRKEEIGRGPLGADLPRRGHDRRPQRGDAHAEPGAARARRRSLGARRVGPEGASQLSHPNLVKVIASWSGRASAAW